MIIHQKSDGQQKLSGICGALGVDEMLGQFCEECAEAIQAAQKVRRSMKGTTPVSKDDALANLTEECADVALLIDCLIELGLVYRTGVQFIGRYKIDRWYRRVVSADEA